MVGESDSDYIFTIWHKGIPHSGVKVHIQETVYNASRKSYVSQSFDDLWSCIVVRHTFIDQDDQQFELKEV